VPCSITNLKYWSRCEQILSKTLTLLNDLSVGYNSVRKLVKLEEVQFMLNNHTVSVPRSIICNCIGKVVIKDGLINQIGRALSILGS
jgi:hypothetical protein